jgi:hypothetical protein
MLSELAGPQDSLSPGSLISYRPPGTGTGCAKPTQCRFKLCRFASCKTARWLYKYCEYRRGAVAVLCDAALVVVRAISFRA